MSNEQKEKLYAGQNKWIGSGVIQNVNLKEAEDSEKCYNNFTLRVNETSYNGKPYHLSIYCTYYGANANLKAGDYVVIEGAIKCVNMNGVYKNIIDVKSCRRVFTDPAGVIESKKKKQAANYDDVGGPPMDDSDIPF